MTVFRRPGTKCPECGHSINAHGSNSKKLSERGPQDGDCALCLYCRAFLVFEQGATQLRLLTPEEIVDLPANVRRELIEAREWFRDHGPQT